jgi:hypothetical protein
MATYVNDLRLKEITTGDESGTWGTSTNTNLELIAEAFSYGTEVITTNADTHTTTIADGATDPGRSLYLKYTGTLDSACTITIGPNTVSKVWIIENGTSGSQNIILSQGSGANITIPAGDTKVVYSDGAGAGAAFFDAFASINVGALTGTSLDISGDIDVDGTTNLDVVDIDGAVDMASTLQVDGAITNSSTIVSTGKITADAGIDIDNINIDGTTIALSSGDLTLDVAGDIILDADGGDVLFYDGGATFGQISKGGGSDLIIGSTIADKDIFFTGIDSATPVTALTLDMSDAGTASFNHDIKVGSGGIVMSDTFNNQANNANVIYRSGSTTVVGNNATALVVADSGSVLAGTTSSQSGSKAVINGNIAIQASVASPGDAFPTLQFYNNNSTGFVNAGITATVGGTINSGNILFNTNSAGSYAERMRIDCQRQRGYWY